MDGTSALALGQLQGDSSPEGAPHLSCHSYHISTQPRDMGVPWDGTISTPVQSVPLGRLVCFRTDAVYVREGWTPKCAGTVTEGKEIGGKPSRRSLQNLVFLLNNSDDLSRCMVTLTVHPWVEAAFSVVVHKRALEAYLQFSRRRGWGQYVWVREFQSIGSVHWHVFHSFECKASGDDAVGAEVDLELSKEVSLWWAEYYGKKTSCERCGVGAFADCEALGGECGRALRRMSASRSRDFVGACRVESLRDSAAGRYAGKEGAKRFQKEAPAKWQKAGAWWRGSRGIKCTPTKQVMVPFETLASSVIEVNGLVIDNVWRLQFSRGLKENTPAEPPGPADLVSAMEHKTIGD